MGKNLKGKDCGKGIYQRKDGLYSARFVDRAGKRHEKYFQTLPEARNWIEEAKYADKHDDVFVATDTTVDEWFEFWIENIVGDLAPNTLRNYRERYARNSAGNRQDADRQCKTDALQKGVHPDGCELCRFHHPSGLYHDGDNV